MAFLVAALIASGAAGLIYQICWIRSATLIVGSTTYAVGIVLATFFGGLALGSAIFGRVAVRTPKPIRLYGWLEAGIALLGLLSIPALWLADTFLVTVSRSTGSSSLVLLTEIGVLAIVLVPPAVLMGGTLPLFCRQLVARRERIMASVGAIYAINTLGAAAGCLAAGLYLIPSMGMRLSIFTAAGLNLLAAAIALRVRVDAPTVAADAQAASAGSRSRRSARAVERRDGPPEGGPHNAPVSIEVMGVLFFLTGAVALANEVLWTRFAALIVTSTITTYTTTIALVLAGIVIGSGMVSFLGLAARAALAFGVMQAVLAVWVLFVMHLAPETWRALGSSTWMYALLFLPPSILSGASFPLAVHAVADHPLQTAERVGTLGGANLAGGIAGALGAALLLPAMGLELGIRVTTMLSLAAAFIAWLVLDRHTALTARIALVVLAGAAWAGTARTVTTRLPHDFLTRNGILLDVREGAHSNLAVSRADGVTLLTSDHWWQGQDEKSHQIMAAHVPMLLHPDPRRVLVVGVGAGQTPARFTMYGIERLDAVDIEPAVFDLVRTHFDSDWMDDARVRLLAEDGRTAIQRSAESYDVISIEVGQLLRPGVGTFYTREFYERVRDRLNEGGLVSQFVPLSFLTPEDFRGVVRTFLEVFPQAVLWYNRTEPLLIGVNGPRLAVDPSRLQLLDAPGPIRDDLRFSLWGGEDQWQNQRHVFLASFLAGAGSLQRLSRDGEVFTDDRPVLDYRAGEVRPAALSQDPILRDIAAGLDPIASLLSGPTGDDVVARADAVRQEHMAEMTSASFVRQATGGSVLPLLIEAVNANPQSVRALSLLGAEYLRASRVDDAIGVLERAAAIDPSEPRVQRDLGAALWTANRRAEAIERFRAAVTLLPDDAESAYRLGAALKAEGNAGEGDEHLRRALALNPGDRRAADALGQRIE